ncbi:MAG TPA: IS1380 family transposase [Streptosporangiaceae bacterium]|nr:IS1380 family transposase [Streptosporangiaceae bacterium]
MRLSHDLAKIHVSFDDPHLVSRAGLVPVVALAERAGLGGLVGEHVCVSRRCGVNAQVKVPCLVAGMAAGADSIDDMDVLRHGAMGALFGGVRAPSTLGSFLRAFTWGNVLQLQKVHREFLAELARRVPLLPGADVLAFIDIDSQQKRVYGHAKQGAAFGHTKIQGKGLLVRGLNVLAATISTPLAAPVVAATRLRGGNASSARGAASMVTEAVGTARAAGCEGTLVVRMDSAFYGAPAVSAARRAGARFSVTVRMDPKVRAAIAAIGEDAWVPIEYPSAIWDGQLGRWVSDAQVAEVEYTAFTSRKGQAVTARLIVRRVKDLNAKAAAGQGELFTAWRYHAVFTDSPFVTLQAEEHHRGHAQAEQVFADWNDGPLAHLPSGSFPANAAWLTCAAIACNLLRAAGALASPTCANARGATLRRDLIDVAARTARHGRGHLTLHLPEGWHREHEWNSLFEATCGPPTQAA